MKLDASCVRAVLLSVEKRLEYYSDGDVIMKSILPASEIHEDMPEYDLSVIAYTILKLDEAGFLNSSIVYADGGIQECYVDDITYNGHAFLDQVRDDGRWKKLKSVASTLGDWSLAGLSAIASQLTSAAAAALISKIT